MRTASLAATLVAALLVALPASAAKDKDKAPALPGTLAVEDVRGTFVITGAGTLVGHIERGSLVVVDRSLNDQWSTRVNGVPYGKSVSARGRDLNFWIPGGHYRVVVKGEGISISARGIGTLHARPKQDAPGPAGIVRVGDGEAQPLSGSSERILVFGGPVEDEQPVDLDSE
ncbi:MAG: hypothetical protein EXQ77_01340 [Thermoleophilia bacterium]|nr:hypothetical protein [Thermoleophilia bacterium]